MGTVACSRMDSPNLEELEKKKRDILHKYGHFEEMNKELARITFCQLAINFNLNKLKIDYFSDLFTDAIDIYFRNKAYLDPSCKDECKRRCLHLWTSAAQNSAEHRMQGGDGEFDLNDFECAMHDMWGNMGDDYKDSLIRTIIVAHFGSLVIDQRQFFPVYVNPNRNAAEIEMVPMLNQRVYPTSSSPYVWANLLPQQVTPLELYRIMSQGNPPLPVLPSDDARLASRLHNLIHDALYQSVRTFGHNITQQAQQYPQIWSMIQAIHADPKILFEPIRHLVRRNVADIKVMYTLPVIGEVTNVDVMRQLFRFITHIVYTASDYCRMEVAAGIISRIASPDGPLTLERILYDFIPQSVCHAVRSRFHLYGTAASVDRFQREFLGECHAHYLRLGGPMHPAFNFKFYIYNSITHRDFANNPAMWTDVVDVFLETHRTIVDVPDVDNVHLIQSQSDLDSALRAFGHQQVGDHAPCWWHNVDVFNRDALLRHCQDPKHQQDPECRGRIRADDNGRSLNASGSRGYLKESMDAFAFEVRQYCDEYRKTNPAFVLRIPTGDELNYLINAALRQKTRACSRALIPSHPDFVTADRRLTYCEFAAIYFFTSVEGPGSFSLYTLLRSSMNYQTVRTMTGQEYVGRISHGLVTVFFSALYKCPRVYEIFWRGLVPDRSRFLHRFITVPSEVFVTYTENVVGSRMTFYCFQSFSLNLSSANIQQFLNISGQNTHVILLRIVINHRTTARYMSHLSEIETENEVLALPCVPYSVLSVDQPRSTAEFADYIRTQSGFDCGSHGVHIPHARGYLIVTLEENNFMKTMNPVNPAKPHAG